MRAARVRGAPILACSGSPDIPVSRLVQTSPARDAVRGHPAGVGEAQVRRGQDARTLAGGIVPSKEFDEMMDKMIHGDRNAPRSDYGPEYRDTPTRR